MNNKKIFIEKIGSIIKRETEEGLAIQSFCFEKDCAGEFLVIKRHNGVIKKIAITNHDLVGILYIIAREMLLLRKD